jgi:glycosyltransferase involved in cell wall biosynthesis
MISILMPIFNGIEFIEDSVNSIINQSYKDWELLIGINGHNMNSNVYKIAKHYETKLDNNKIRVFDLYEAKGKSETLNQLIPKCNYDFVSLLDVDDIWNIDKLQIQSRYLHKYDVIGSNCIYFGDLPGIMPNIPLGDISKFDFNISNPMINSSCIIRKKLSYWNNVFTEDYDLWLRLKKQGNIFYNCNEVLVMHRIHKDSFYNSKSRYGVVK